jgi:predicted amidohydrolase YtcJ
MRGKVKTVAADFVFYGGPVYDPLSGIKEAVATKGTRILASGPKAEIMALSGPRTRLYDLEGSLLMPGFIDAHLHITGHGTGLSQVNCKYPAVRSIGDVQEAFRERARSTPPGAWVVGRGYDHLKLAEKRHPTRHDLDEVSTQHPIVLTRTCGHICAVNSVAMALAGITAGTPDPTGGKIDRDESGVPNGVLREAAQRLLRELSAPTHEELVQGTVVASKHLISLGITSVHDASGSTPLMRAIVEAVQSGRAKTRIYTMLGSSDPEFQGAYLRSGLRTGFGDDHLRLGPMKLMTDGSSSGPTAATRRPYAIDPSNSGILYFTQDEITEKHTAAHRAGFQVTAHAVGDRAVEMNINGIESAVRAFPRPDPRHRIEHCAMTGQELRSRIKRLGIVPIAQPVFFHEFGDGYVLNYGRERAEEMFTTASFIRERIPFAMSTDCPVTFPDPTLNISVAMTRWTMTGDVVGPQERITLEQALYAYTMGGAYAAFEENVKGSLQPGRLADLVVWTGNPFGAEPDQIREMTSRMTMIDGQVVFER